MSTNNIGGTQFGLTGNPEADAMRYAQARGISLDEAKNQLKRGKENIDVYFGDDIQAFIQSTQMKSGRVASGELAIDKTGNYLDYNDGSAIIVNISAKSLKILYDRYSRALLGLNLRYYIKNRNVDSGLKKTIKNHPDKFWYLNNGLVIVCSDYELDGKILKLSNFSIDMFILPQLAPSHTPN